MRDGYITITDGHGQYIETPYESGELLSVVLQRAVYFSTPCKGKGVCGGCSVFVRRENGKEQRELACMYEVTQPLEVTVYPLMAVK